LRRAAATEDEQVRILLAALIVSSAKLDLFGLGLLARTTPRNQSSYEKVN
jgi:hypothetical protein